MTLTCEILAAVQWAMMGAPPGAARERLARVEEYLMRRITRD